MKWNMSTIWEASQSRKEQVIETDYPQNLLHTDGRNVGQSEPGYLLGRWFHVLLAAGRGQQAAVEPAQRERQSGVSGAAHRLDQPEKPAREH